MLNSLIQNTFHAFFSAKAHKEDIDFNKEKYREDAEFIKGIDDWANENAPDENRVVAAQRIKNAYSCKEASLNLDSLGLTTLPMQIGEMTHLSVLTLNGNKLTNIAALSNLTNLDCLNLCNNLLTEITSLSGLINLTTLVLQNNQLTNISALSNLTKLSNLYLRVNQIADVTCLPEIVNLKILDLANNQLTGIPDSLLRLSSISYIALENNRFSETVIGQLHTTVNVAHYTGPRITFSMAGVSDQEYKAPPLVDVVARWYAGSMPDTLSAFSRAAWEEIENEASAKDFSIFLERLHNTVNSTQAAFRARVFDWLKRLECDQGLRHEIFLEAKEGLGSCEDRISLTFNAMKQRELTLNVERQHYDGKWDELISLARQAFRFNELAKIAYEKVQSLRFVDEVEVYLAYLVKSYKDLNLDLDTPEMRFFDVAGVTEDDIQVAVLRIKQNENTQFLNYLTNEWAPWPAVLERLQPKVCEKLDAMIYAAKENAFENQQAAFAVDAAANDVSRLQVMREELDKIAIACKREFTQAFLQEKGLGTLLNGVW